MTARSRYSYRFTLPIEYNAAKQNPDRTLGTIISPSAPFEEISILRRFGLDPSDMNSGAWNTGGYLTISLVDYSVATLDVSPSPSTVKLDPRIPLLVRIGPFTRRWWIRTIPGSDRANIGMGDNFIIRIPLADIGLGRLGSDIVSFSLDTQAIGDDEAKTIFYGNDPAVFPTLFIRPLRLLMLIDIYVGDPAVGVLGTE